MNNSPPPFCSFLIFISFLIDCFWDDDDVSIEVLVALFAPHNDNTARDVEEEEGFLVKSFHA